MDNPLTPVEAITRETEHVRGFVEDGRDIMVDPRMMAVFLAALELAKADTQMAGIRNREFWGHSVECICSYCCSIRDARTNLHEALQA